MKCINCGGTEFEKAEYDGEFTTPFFCDFSGYRFTSHQKTVIVPRYFHACLKCGLVHQILDLEARREGMKELIDYVLEQKLTEPDRHDDRNFRIERISMDEVSKITNIPRSHMDELMKELLHDHKGYDTRGYCVSYQGDLTPVLHEGDGKLWIYGRQK